MCLHKPSGIWILSSSFQPESSFWEKVKPQHAATFLCSLLSTGSEFCKVVLFSALRNEKLPLNKILHCEHKVHKSTSQRPNNAVPSMAKRGSSRFTSNPVSTCCGLCFGYPPVVGRRSPQRPPNVACGPRCDCSLPVRSLTSYTNVACAFISRTATKTIAETIQLCGKELRTLLTDFLSLLLRAGHRPAVEWTTVLYIHNYRTYSTYSL